MKRNSGLTRPFRTAHHRQRVQPSAKGRAEEFDRLDGAFGGRPAAGEMRRRDEGMTRLNRSIHFDNTNKDHFRAHRRRRPSAALHPRGRSSRAFNVADRCETDFAAMAFQLFGQRKPKLALATGNCWLVVHSRALRHSRSCSCGVAGAGEYGNSYPCVLLTLFASPIFVASSDVFIHASSRTERDGL